MPRVRRTTNTGKTIKLVELIDSYYANKQEEKKFKDAAAEQNKELKAILTEDDKYLKENSTKHNERCFSTGDLIVEYYEKDKTSFNEEALIEFLNEKGYTEAIKTKQYVDMKVLESMIYNEKIAKKDLAGIDKCKVPKWEPTLTVKEVKTKGEQ